jgi:hypothetical protein
LLHYCGSLYEIEAKDRLPKGKHVLRFHFDYDGGGIGQAGTMGTLLVELGEQPKGNRGTRTTEVPRCHGEAVASVAL